MSVWCWVGLHAPPIRELMPQARGSLLWRCPRCQTVLGVSTYKASPALTRRLKANAQRARLRLVKAREA